MKFIFSAALFFCYLFTEAQDKAGTFKPVIDSSAIDNWADLASSNTIISKNGRYFIYSISNKPAGDETLIIQSTNGSWKKEIIGTQDGFFSDDNRQAIFKKNDTLCFQQLGSDSIKLITGVFALKQPNNVKGKLLAYRLKKTNELIVRNLNSGKEQKFGEVEDFHFENNGNILLFNTKNVNGYESLHWVNLKTGISNIIWSNNEASSKDVFTSSYSFDEQANQLVFIVRDKNVGKGSASIWYYRAGSDRATMQISNQSLGTDSGLVIGLPGPLFNKSGKYILFNLEPDAELVPKPQIDALQVDVWNYNDMVLQHQQFGELKKTGRSTLGVGISQGKIISAMAVDGNKIIHVNDNEESVNFDLKSDNEVLVRRQKYNGDKIWLDELPSWYLVSLNNGYRRLIGKESALLSISPDNRNLVFYDSKERTVLNYDVMTGKTNSISDRIPERLTDKLQDEKTKDNYYLVGIAGWLANNELMIYDNYDIWKVNVKNASPGLNLTNGYGKKHRIKFRLVSASNSSINYSYRSKRPILLSAFNLENKNNGFFYLWPQRLADPELLTMEPCSYMNLVKAANGNVWIVKRETSVDAPNYYLSKDLKKFHPLTNYQPQAKYNWLTTDLIEWTMPNGKSCQGILYKPENFDSRKKYPVIIHYYEKLSGDLFHFPRPEFTSGAINIPWFVSRGYIIFTPDIHYTVGDIAESIVISVLSGVRHIFKYPFVDSTKIGIQGHSFGGFETNILVANTNIFKAAAEGAGPTDLISIFGTPLADGAAIAFSPHNEKGGQFRLEFPLSENPEVYIKNSPIFKANKITTPLLIMHNKRDENVPWQQGVELFVALRRLSKLVWMLQYDNSGHGLNEKDAMDYTIRLMQFFDHYLKGSPAPKWMTIGIPANLKGIETGYSFDPSGNCGKDCKVCKMWNEKRKKDSVATMAEIQEEAKTEHWIGSDGK
ncbi:MAG: prolyl oligopeptidase family serine peptidase [Chitinophagaceae bacterium]